MAKNSLTGKFFSILILSLLLCIPLAMIGMTVGEREQSRNAVRADIAASSAGSQTLAGPVLVLPYRELVTTASEDEHGKRETTTAWVSRVKYWLPENLDIRGDMDTERRHRGIYEVEIFRTPFVMQGNFDIKPGELVPSDTVRYEQPYLALGVSDVRGIMSMPILKLNDQVVALESGSNIAAFPGGLHAAMESVAAGRLNFNLQLDIKGMESLEFLPLGRDTTISLASTWPHPSFFGRYLPDAPEISGKGFQARWRSNFLSNNMETLFANCMNGNCEPFNNNVLGVRLIDAVDVYLQAERAHKYGILFVALTFAAFLLFEVLKDLRIHPVQYSLVGVSLVLFFLLLLSLSEHIAFLQAYITASAACIGLITFYVSYVLHSVWRALGFAALLAGLFGALYGLLQSEDFALLLGSLLLFVIVAGIMVITRKLDWYKVGGQVLGKSASAP